VLIPLLLALPVRAELYSEVSHGYADSDGVRIHYATAGQGPLLVMIHGFPDFWYSWRHQMAGLRDRFQVVAVDQRGYNRSDSPAGEENYAMSFLVADVLAVIRHLGRDSATIVGHDWGGAVAWNLAFAHPEAVDRLVILNLPHPNGMAQARARNPRLVENARYAEVFRQGSPADPQVLFGGPMNPATLAGWVSDPVARERYLAAFARSDFDAMLAYYKQNYPAPDAEPGPPAPRLSMPVLMFHGLEDRALPSDGLNNTWDWLDGDLTLVTAPGAGHFVQQDAAELVTDTLRWWLEARQ
jgi:pimeloyl-ACP methyl ester carboxylesterase